MVFSLGEGVLGPFGHLPDFRALDFIQLALKEVV